jgi:hypothetical protein
MPRVPIRFYTLVLGAALLVSGPLMQPLSAQDGKRPEAGAIYSGPSEVTFEWQYSCPNGRGCSFNCPGAGGAANVTKLATFADDTS